MSDPLESVRQLAAHTSIPLEAAAAVVERLAAHEDLLADLAAYCAGAPPTSVGEEDLVLPELVALGMGRIEALLLIALVRDDPDIARDYIGRALPPAR